MKEKNPELHDTETAERLFGSVTPREQNGGHEPDPDILRAPLPEGESAHVFCESCGAHTPITTTGAEVLAGRAEVLTTPDWTKNYIQVHGCIWCNDAFNTAEILPIP